MYFFLLFFIQGIRKTSAKKQDIKEYKTIERPPPGRKWQAFRLSVALGLSG